MKTRCNEVLEDIDRFLDGDLPAPQRAEVAAHLETCRECREQMHSVRQTTAAMAGLPHLTCPDHVVRRLEEAVTSRYHDPSLAERLRARVGRLQWRPVAFALPIVAAVLLIALLRPTHRTPESAAYSEEEVRIAEKQAAWTLSFVAQTINNAQEKTVEELVRESLRSMIRTRLRDAVQRTEGDQS